MKAKKDKKMVKDMPEKDMEKCKADMGGCKIEVEVECEEEEYMEEEDVLELLHEYAHYFYQEMQYQMNWVWAELDYLAQSLYNHQKGHLPPINGAEKMQKALDVLGIGSDYEVQKPIVWVQASKSSPASLEIDISAKK